MGQTVTPVAEGMAQMPWQALFWMNVPLTLLALFMVLYGLRNVEMHRSGGSFDYIGTALLVGGLTALNVGLGANIDVGGATRFEDISRLPENFEIWVTSALIMFALFGVVEFYVKDPLVPPSLFRKRDFNAGGLTNVFVGFCLMVGLVAVPILVNVRQESPEQIRDAALQVGLLLSALTVPMAVATIPGGWLSDRFGYRAVTMGGLAMSVVGFLAMWQTWELGIADRWIILHEAIIGVGLGLTFAPISASVINAAADRDRGIASALVLVLRLIGMTVSVTALTTYSLNQVNIMAEQQLGPEAAADVYAYAATYAEIAVDVLAQLGLIGAVVAVIALVPAAFLGGRASDDAQVTRQTDEFAQVAGD